MRTAKPLLIWMSLLVLAQGAQAFTANGHDVIEATAYRHLLAQANIRRLSAIAGHVVSGKDALDLLIAYRILARPRDWKDGPVTDVLNTLPVLRSGNLDYILSRQFEGNSQCFHFMARASDIYWDTTTDPTYHYPHMLYDSAYPRCIAFLTSTFRVVLNNALAARAGNHDAYALMHCIADSYCSAHTDRDSNWTIIYLKVWEPTAFVPFLLHPYAERFWGGPWGHKLVDKRDAGYWDNSVVDPTCSSATNPYQVHYECLSRRAKEAVTAIQDLLIVLAENVLRERMYHGIDTTFERTSWHDYLATYFMGWKGLAPIRELRPDEREWMPLLHAGIEYHPTTIAATTVTDLTADVNLDLPLGYIAPITPGIMIGAGKRYFPGGASGNLLQFGLDIAFEFADDFEIRMSPFEREILLAPTVDGLSRARNVVSFFQIEGILDRHFWVRLEAPRFSNLGWVPNDFAVAAGYSDGFNFAQWFTEHIGSDEPQQPAGSLWHVPSPEEIRTATLGSGMSLSASPIDMEFTPYAEQLFGASLQLLWDRNSSGERYNGFANGIDLAFSPFPLQLKDADEAVASGGIADAGYILRYYFGPHLALTMEPVDGMYATDGSQPHPSGNLRWDVQSTIGIMALLMHTDLTVGIARISWRDLLAKKNPFYQELPAQLRIGANIFVP